MCGFVGLVGNHNISDDAFRSTVLHLKHRGPDDTGIKNIRKWKAHLGHVRLAVMDTSSSGAQPMQDCTGNFVLVFNGEIYNFKELRDRLKSNGAVFTTNSDSEVLLEAYKAYGVDVVSQLEGMFAFAIFDLRTGHVFLARDRFGVKPLYYHVSNGVLYFASEHKALLPLIGNVELSAIAKYNYFKTGYIPANQSIYQGVQALPPGHHVVFKDIAEDHILEEYWSAGKTFMLKRSRVSREDILNHVRNLLIDSFQLRMVSDVPVGVFLSGGIDSTLLASILKVDLDVDLQTFTIGFEDEKCDESRVAARSASLLGIKNHRTICTYSDFRRQFQNMYRYFDEPFADSSTPLTMLVSEVARAHVTVSLSADGGDELFGGYSKYRRNDHAHRTLMAIPKFAGPSLGRQVEKRLQKKAKCMDFAHLGRLEMIRNSLLEASNDTRRFIKIENVIFSDAELQQYLPSVSICNRARSAVAETGHPQGIESYMLHDMRNYMVGDILKKVDMSTMAHGLEAREPYLDHKLCEYLGGIAPKSKFFGRSTKAILRTLLYRYIPKDVINLPKQGFGAPLVEWSSQIIKEHRPFLEASALSDGMNGQYLHSLFKQSTDSGLVMAKLWTLLNYYLWAERWAPNTK